MTKGADNPLEKNNGSTDNHLRIITDKCDYSRTNINQVKKPNKLDGLSSHISVYRQ